MATTSTLMTYLAWPDTLGKYKPCVILFVPRPPSRIKDNWLHSLEQDSAIFATQRSYRNDANKRQSWELFSYRNATKPRGISSLPEISLYY